MNSIDENIIKYKSTIDNYNNVNSLLNAKLKMVDLFAGTGAFSYVFEKSGKVDVVYANDMADASKTIYDMNLSHKLTLKNLNDIVPSQIPAHDILTGGFPCFVEGTKVLTDTGYINIEKLSGSELVLTHTGKYQQILNCQIKEYNQNLYSVKVDCNPHDIVCTPEHPFYVRIKNSTHISKPEWVPAHKLTNNCYVGVPLITNYDPRYDYIKKRSISFDYDNIPSIELAYEIQRYQITCGNLCKIVKNNTAYQLEYNNTTSFIDGNYAWFKVESSTENSSNSRKYVYNLEVENDNSYCVENVIVHNCQPFSIAGKQKGFDDERSNVFWKILAIIDYHNPKCIILENVKNLLSHDDNNTFRIIKTNLEQRNYHICYKVLNTADITGVPQNRERIYIVCIKSKTIFDKFNLEFENIPKKLVSEFFEPSPIPNKYYYTDTSSTWDLVKTNIIKKNTIYQYRRVYVRENKSNECPTLTANMGTGGHNVPLILDDKGIRKLTPRECFNFQGFPSNYKLPTNLSDCNLYKLAGNACSIPIIKLIADRLIPLLI